MKATDIYISSSLNPNQITSGTLSYAMGAGRPVISTPFLHAKEILNDSVGRFARFKSSSSFSRAIIELLSDDNLRKEMGRIAYAETRKMTWHNVAKSYMNIFNEKVPITEKYSKILPKIKLGHLQKLTDSFGIIQFSKNTKPDIESGYTLDDNARALAFCCDYLSTKNDESVFKLLEKYFDFVKYTQSDDGNFYNLVDKNKVVDKEDWSSDAFGRAIWALGVLFSSKNVPEEIRFKASKMIEKAAPIFSKVESSKSIAFILIGLCEYNKTLNSQEVTNTISSLADILVKEYKENSSSGWDWFQSYLTYSNGRQSEALFKAYAETKNQDYLDVAVSTTDFLISTTFQNEMFCPVGHDGWYHKSGKRAHFDQQPVDACSMIDLLIDAYQATKKEKYFENAYVAFDWFLGNNETGCAVYDELSGGCHDGLGSATINLNEGAESTISYLSARLRIKHAKELVKKKGFPSEKEIVLNKDLVSIKETVSHNLKQ